jgi:ribosomal protein L32
MALRVGRILKEIENIFALAFGRQFPPRKSWCILIQNTVKCLHINFSDDITSFSDGLCVVAVQANATNKAIPDFTFSPEKLFNDGFLWAVPRKRRTVERRLSRKFGYPEYSYKLLLPKRNLLVCNTCGHHHEANHLCRKYPVTCLINNEILFIAWKSIIINRMLPDLHYSIRLQCT